MQATLTIEGKTFGRSRALFPDWTMGIEEVVETPKHLNLGELIARIVREQVRMFGERQAQRRLVNALTEYEISEAAGRGKVDMGGRADDTDVDSDTAVATALQAFQDGLYFVFVDDLHIDDLDVPVRLRLESRVTFLRLVALAGG